MLNIMSVDVEDWFCVYNLSHRIRFEEWAGCESRVERNMTRLLDLFGRHRIEATHLAHRDKRRLQLAERLHRR